MSNDIQKLTCHSLTAEQDLRGRIAISQGNSVVSLGQFEASVLRDWLAALDLGVSRSIRTIVPREGG